MKDEELAEEQKLCLKAQSFKEDVKAHDIDVINAVENKLDAYKVGRYEGFLAGLKAGRPQWYKLSEKYPEADKLVRVHLMSGMEHICETCYYEPTEDEIGYGKLIINFYELNGEWVDDNDVIAWCEIPTFDKE